jgi:hypothetical protein
MHTDTVASFHEMWELAQDLLLEPTLRHCPAPSVPGKACRQRGLHMAERVHLELALREQLAHVLRELGV